MSNHTIGLFDRGSAKRRASVALVALLLSCIFAAQASAGISIAINVAPPPLPVYVQPPCPGEDYVWTPGYWAWADAGYYWVPGTWVLAPEPGLLWTPGYWAWEGTQFVFHDGYWGPHVGFYGGINYGFGYGGVGFDGGYWSGGHFYYNRAITNVSVMTVRNVYTKKVIHNTINVISYNGGTGGIAARPTSAELRAATERHVPAVVAQREHVMLARNNPALRAESNHGRPTIAATPHAGKFSGADSRRDEASVQRASREMQARQQRELQTMHDRQAAERAEMDRQHASDERRTAIAATHAREQQEIAQRHEREKQELKAQHEGPHPEA